MAYFCHQITEKALKAIVASVTTEVPPKIHDLIKLANHSGIYEELTEERLSFIEEIDHFQIEARYPEYKANLAKTLNHEKCRKILEKTEDFLCWIKEKLEKLP